MMHKLTKFQLACAVMLAIFGMSQASAFSSSNYATSSVLATGKWVKVAIPENGMYEITYAELTEMGFNNPAQVKLYGNGGNPISEVLSGTVPDDLQRVPILRMDDKICFYGLGPVAFTISDYGTTPHFTRTFNAYSNFGYYFLVEESGSDTTPVKKAAGSATNYVNVPSCLSFFIHENELTTVSSTGRQMLGEEFSQGQLLVDYQLPSIIDSTVVVQSSVGINTNGSGVVNAVLHSGGASDTTNYSVYSASVYPSAKQTYYNDVMPFGKLKLTHPAEQGQFEPWVRYSQSANSGDLVVKLAYLDFFIITYKRENVIRTEDDNQLLMGYTTTKGTEHFQLPNVSSDVVVWSIDEPSTPKQMILKSYDDESGSGLYFTSTSASVSQYVAFDPTKTLKKISSYETVGNQNLHALAVPDMLIITTPVFHAQAQRLADMHAAVDGIDVAVVNHDQVFNEFSSGTRDAMAYRLICKMFYDRDPEKFKYLLLFGPGSYDNREFLGEHPNNLLTYQSENSSYEAFSYTADDFFGFLDDNSGENISSDKLTIGVGRITCTDEDEARSDVDKIVEYYTTPDYGVWRNNTIVFSDSPDEGLYLFQGEGYKNMIDNELGTGMHVNTVHNTMYPRDPNQAAHSIERRTATVAKQQLSQFLKSGSLFATYVGHAGPTTFTKTNYMWTISDVMKTTYPHWPVMSTACCDVAHFDSDSRGIAELMFHKRDGGAIGLMTSSRMVYADKNDVLNKGFMNALFSFGTTGKMTTLGDAYKEAKRSIDGNDPNKLSFFLLGDPAMKFNYPISRFTITKVNGTTMSDSTVASISPLCEFEIMGRVTADNGALDYRFNGDATATLYDKQELFTTLTGTDNGATVDRDIYFNRPKLAEITGRVSNGIFKGTMVAPKSVMASGEPVLLRLYAHKDNSAYMVNGFTTQIEMAPYNEAVAIQDTVAPVITTMYVNDEELFTSGGSVGSSAVAYITATDDYGINVQSNSMEYGMSLVLDGGKTSYSEVGSYLTMADGCKTINIEFPMENLSEGLHTLTYTVFDMTGNSTSQTITFMVGDKGNTTLVADKWPAYRNEEVNFDVETSLTRVPEMTIRVTDATGKLVWMQEASNFPVAWDLKDMKGNSVPAGLYRYFGTYSNGTNYGGTPISKLIVLDELKRTITHPSDE